MTRSARSFAPQTDVVLATWSTRVVEPAQVPVLPDGCCDVIVIEPDDAPARWFVAELSSSAYVAEVDAGVTMHGFRLRPGATPCRDALERFVRGRDARLLLDGDAMRELVVMPDGVAEMLQSFATAEPVPTHARRLGVTPRTLQRTTKALTGQSPLFWIHLARVRSAARSLTPGASLAAIAGENGYADQAHLTRDVRRWMGVPPAQFARDAERQAAIRSVGYA